MLIVFILSLKKMQIFRWQYEHYQHIERVYKKIKKVRKIKPVVMSLVYLFFNLFYKFLLYADSVHTAIKNQKII